MKQEFQRSIRCNMISKHLCTYGKWATMIPQDSAKVDTNIEGHGKETEFPLS